MLMSNGPTARKDGWILLPMIRAPLGEVFGFDSRRMES